MSDMGNNKRDSKKKWFFMGPLFQRGREAELLTKVISGFNVAPNLLQWNIIDGLNKNLGEDISIINGLPIGVWPFQYKDFFLKECLWNYYSGKSIEIGGINIPFIKQKHRYTKAKKWLSKNASDGDIVLVYSAYVPFLKAAVKTKKRLVIIPIITDLPEYYDLGKVCLLKRLARRINNRIVYSYLNKADKYVFLTEQMAKAMGVESGRYIVVEGICNPSTPSNTLTNNMSNHKRIVFFYAGALLYKYGIQELLSAFSKTQNPNYELWICGKGEASASVEEFERIDSRIKYKGYVTSDEVSRLIHEADFLINPRKPTEEYTKYSFPSKTLEYMISGKPVIMYRLPGIPEEYYEYVIGINGLSEEALVDTIEYAASLCVSERERIGKSARSFVLEKKNPIAQTKRIIDFALQEDLNDE